MTSNNKKQANLPSPSKFLLNATATAAVTASMFNQFKKMGVSPNSNVPDKETQKWELLVARIRQAADTITDESLEDELADIADVIEIEIDNVLTSLSESIVDLPQSSEDEIQMVGMILDTYINPPPGHSMLSKDKRIKYSMMLDEMIPDLLALIQKR